MTWANESECCEHLWTVNGSSTFNVFLFVSPCFARSYCWFYMPKKLLPFFWQACVLGAAPVGALSYGFWTFTQRAAETRQSCCRRHVSCWALWMYQNQEGRVGLLNMLNSRDLTWLHLVQQRESFAACQTLWGMVLGKPRGAQPKSDDWVWWNCMKLHRYVNHHVKSDKLLQRDCIAS